jgi:hypothetical protein
MAVQVAPFQKYGLIPVADPDTIIDPDAIPVGVVVLGTSVKILLIVTEPDAVNPLLTSNDPVISTLDPPEAFDLNAALLV